MRATPPERPGGLGEIEVAPRGGACPRSSLLPCCQRCLGFLFFPFIWAYEVLEEKWREANSVLSRQT